jgi:hypothetical protein
MKNKFARSLTSLSKIATKFDTETFPLKISLLQTLCKSPLRFGKQLLQYHDILLFFCAYPGDTLILRLSDKELKRIAIHLKKCSAVKKSLHINEGLPFTDTITRFSPDLLSWLVIQKDIKAVFDSNPHPSLPINEVMNVTLPTLLKEETTAGLDFEGLMDVLHIKPKDYVRFILGQLEESVPLVRDLIMEHLDLFVKLSPTNLQYSRAFNRVPVQEVFYHQDLLKQFDHIQLINTPIQEAIILNKSDQEHLIKVIKYAMPLTQREIDTASYLEGESLRLYKLERGIMVAVYGMTAERQLPLESSVGFTLFKNGIPLSYGGTWIFGPRARFGLNIFDPFRGGESGYTLCQLLRVFRQVFKINYFEIESYMFGYANPEGISTGTFWFYYKYGFRPVAKDLFLLAEQERQKIKTRKNYRSTEKTLIRFTDSNMALNLGKNISMDVTEITLTILSKYKNAWQHNYSATRQHAVKEFLKKMNLNSNDQNADELKVLEEVAQWAWAMKITDSRKLDLMWKMVYTKPKDLYAYQQLLLDFFIK